jgi:hypothetical protein
MTSNETLIELENICVDLKCPINLYEKYTAGMFVEEKQKKVKKLKSDL